MQIRFLFIPAKSGICIFLISFLITQTIIAQNQPPSITNLRVAADTLNQRVVFTYDLSDLEEDSLDVFLRVSGDGGQTFIVNTDSVSGDVGYPILPGLNKELTWYYNTGEAEKRVIKSGSFQAKLVAADRSAANIQDLVNQVDEARMMADLQAIVGVRHFSAGPTLLEATKDYMETEFGNNGLQSRRHDFAYTANYTGQNIIGRHPGHIEEGATYIIDGHYDTVRNTPGADDNGTGVVGTLEAMRVLSTASFSKSIEFIGFDLEEVGIVGSRNYVNSGILDYQTIEGAVNFEMIGFTCEEECCDAFRCIGDYIINASDSNSTELRLAFDQAAQSYVTGLAVASVAASGSDPNFRRSDHIRFWDAGLKALFLTDGANFRNPHYHQTSDDISTLDMAFLVNVVKTTVAMIAELAEIRNIGYAISDPFELDTSIIEEPEIPASFQLFQNYPNPFNPRTTISYALPVPADVQLVIYNLSGQRVRSAVAGPQSAGTQAFIWDGRDDKGIQVASGIYIYQLATNKGQQESRKMVLLR